MTLSTLLNSYSYYHNFTYRLNGQAEEASIADVILRTKNTLNYVEKRELYDLLRSDKYLDIFYYLSNKIDLSIDWD